MKEELVRIVTEVSKECRKQLRIMAIQKETTLQLVIREVLERAMSKRGSKVAEDAQTEST